MSGMREELGRSGEDGRGPEAQGGVGYHVGVGGSTDGPVVAGSYNVVVDARHGSVVTVERERPAPVRRDRISVLPRRTREPLGREAEAAALTAAVAAEGLVRLCGPAGVGKSTLLRHVARGAASGPDGVVFVSAAHRQVADLAQEVFEACYRTQGYAPSRADLRGLLTGLRITVYVDNADLTIDQLRELTDLVPDATFVLAGRDSTPIGDGAVHHLAGLGQDVAARLLTRALGRPLHDAEHATAVDLWQVSGGNPLLLLRAAGVAGSGRQELPPPAAVGDLLPLLLDQLDEAARKALNLLATLGDAELATVHIGALTGEPDPAGVCDRLTGLGLVTPGEHGYLCAPGVVPAVQRRDDAAIPVDGLCRYFTRWVGDPATTPAQVAAHSRAIERVAGLTTDAGLPELTVALGRAASPKLAHSLRFDAWGRTLSRGWVGARRAGDREAEAYFTHEEGVRSLVTGRWVVAGALLAQAGVLWHVLGDQRGSAAATDAHRFLPPELQPPGRIDVPEHPGPGEGDTPDIVAEHMADLDHAVPEPPSPATFDSVDAAYSGTDPSSFEMPPDPGPPSPPADLTTAPGGDFGVTANAGSAAPAGAVSTGATGATGATAATGASAAAAAAQGTSLLTMFLVGLAVVGTIAAVAYNKNKEEQALGNWPTVSGTGIANDWQTGITGAAAPTITSAPPTGIAGTWEIYQDAFTIEESGYGAYVYRTECGDSIQLSGDDTQVSGQAPVRTRDSAGASCGPIIGYNAVTFTMGAGPDTAWWTETMPPDEAELRTCGGYCGTTTLTRVG
ncbi:AAA ATPase [Saccharothrix espanaensis DSM 44229]|uniref:AAA ATPase n=2 Tax=Saccharothrix espanaensis TaxID=103731 RepID=K0K3R2_SACES|nr:ATP-binding protein [Saccharothrix espanaensis]CCH32217.1 AAA ATPase [Saccharothrix espanaensis DSM 44229]